MKIQFKKSDTQPGLDLVYINEVLAGEFISDLVNKTYLFKPAKGDRILLSRVAYDEACQLLTDELAQLYPYFCAKAA